MQPITGAHYSRHRGMSATPGRDDRHRQRTPVSNFRHGRSSLATSTTCFQTVRFAHRRDSVDHRLVPLCTVVCDRCGDLTPNNAYLPPSSLSPPSLRLFDHLPQPALPLAYLTVGGKHPACPSLSIATESPSAMSKAGISLHPALCAGRVVRPEVVIAGRAESWSSFCNFVSVLDNRLHSIAESVTRFTRCLPGA
jgi:hypothetical protein